MQVQFWGTRGSIPRPGPDTLRYGGNTSCVEVRTVGGTLAVLDCGTGAFELGQSLLAAGQPIRGHLFISHTHWDHIQGFPFFAPLFMPGAEWDIYGPGGLGQRLEDLLAGQMESSYFPITLGQLDATIRYHDLVEGSYQVGDLSVTTRYLNHPALTLGYRFESGGAALVYAVDHEPHSWQAAGRTEPFASPPADVEEQRHIDFLRGAGLVIHDTQYTESEYPDKVGWGHATAGYAVNAASLAGAGSLALFHHDPRRDDAAVESIEGEAQEKAARAGGLKVMAARQGTVTELPEFSGTTGAPVLGPALASGPATLYQRGIKTILIADDDPVILELTQRALRTQGFRLLFAADGVEALSLARREKPDLILLDWGLPGISGLDLCRRLRDGPDAYLRSVPVLMITARSDAEAAQAGLEWGFNDYMTKPFTPAQLLARALTWLLRSA